ncbi:DNA alkylation repair protein [Stenotrophomonas sp. GD03908]|uniref:DNA alkylation repair protein n=1 Tax=Stenotrophomonas maltophilia TaxID=40324 RepID=A0AAJ2WJQ8_STEMA|nr:MULTISPECIES: DNA alkylation repair protein [Stenotrophomonas]MBH1483834.1 DNA alkylation repair protein [Stenotrophomonas maltophilia]MDH0981317.1 DNA alkylation repair protein [Stenotrophomonas sp. GD03908]MDQ7293582.1 DNA alkylation repair protein [Stenotrophomonas sp. Sm0041]MDZ5765016.1 DNA alkylation repair protein [Stenotrophomonas maltophilia]
MSRILTAERLNALNTGSVAASHLAECLAVDFGALLQAVVPAVEHDALHRMRDAEGKGITQRMALAARLLRESGQGDPAQWQDHASDTVRGWACYLIGSNARATLAGKLQQMRALADDPHFGVREWAWLALRTDIVAAPMQALEYLQPWTQEASPYLRRFACEALRPRGVWATHIALFKRHPEHALPLLEALANDPERYVQDSVGNWLNDAGKTRPHWLRDLCARWQREHDGGANAYIRKRALRSLR